MATGDRPISPHLQVHRMLPNMAQSITHRITGAALTVGTLLLVYWIGAAAAGPEAYAAAQGLIGSILGRLLLFGWTWALFYHLCAGIRHLVWDTGHGYDLRVTDLSGWAVVGGSVALTLLAWIVGYMVMG
ncbi:MAG: succinate dehydrogenase, cytochrome b556 subunit [Azospirillaceae bacterium]